MALARKSAPQQRILAADDHRTTLSAIASMLRGAGYRVTEAKDGEEALEKIRKSRCDLAFLDIWMPKVTGLEVLAEARAFPACPKIIVMTSDNAPGSVLGAVRAQ